MSHHRILIGISTVLLSTIVVGCAARTTTAPVGLADAGGTSSSPSSALCGTWQGSFWHVTGAHASSPGTSDLTLQVSGDSTYTLTWADRPPSTGTIAARGTRVILADESGARTTLVHSGDALYGVMQDSVNGSPTMLNLEKRAPLPGRSSRITPRC